MSEHADEPLNLDTETLLDKAVAALGGSQREGQVRMATAVAAALDKERLEAIVAGAVAAAQADTVTVVSDARVTRQVPADQIQEVQA